MEKQLIAKLNKLNREFYEHHAASFDQSRAFAWSGWQRLVDEGFFSPKNLKILDAGCGNARFLGFILEQKNVSIDKYLGVDSSKGLLDLAHKKFENMENVEFSKLDLLDLSDMNKLDSKYNVVASFGVLHHVPCFYQRSALIQLLASKLAKNGIIVFTLWQFMKSKRLAEKRLNESQVEKVLGASKQYMEGGDFLLDWDKTGVPRYCHNFDHKEIEKIITELKHQGLKLISNFEADGKEGNLNRYLAFQKIAN